MALPAQLVVVLGPTGVGKSDLAVELALATAARGTPAEIVNADSMQLYRGMDIGTAKLPVEDRRGVPHHLLDVLDVTESASVAQFQRRAREVIADCHGRGVLPVLVGGSSLYLRAVVDDLRFPGTDPAVRARWDEQLRRLGGEALHAELAARDPEAAAQILVSNGRRIVRALEVIELTGQPFTATMPGHDSVYDDVAMVGLGIDRETLDDRLRTRVDRMWAAGLVDEVRGLIGRGIERGLTAPRALGYQQVLAFLRGECSEDEAREETVNGTRRFARRQERLFRKDPRVTWLPYDAADRVGLALATTGVVGARP